MVNLQKKKKNYWSEHTYVETLDGVRMVSGQQNFEVTSLNVLS